jgi:hypothetical protein
MTSPYQRAKHPSTFEIPEVRDELLYSQRLLYRLCTLENEGNPLRAAKAQRHFTEVVQRSFQESLHDLAEDVHIACDWALKHNGRNENVIRAAILFAGALLNNKETSTAVLILRKVEPATNGDRELKAIWAINSAIAFLTFKPDAIDGYWQTAIREMPLPRWIHYPSLIMGCRDHIRKLRIQHQENGDLQALLAAAPLAERAYAALTQRVVKGSHIETSRETVSLLIELAKTQHVSSTEGLGSLDIPGATPLMELAVINAAANKQAVDLFAKSLTFLAHHYSACGDREKARDTAVQAIAECAQLPIQNPAMIRILHAIFESNKD